MDNLDELEGWLIVILFALMLLCAVACGIWGWCSLPDYEVWTLPLTNLGGVV